MSIIEPIDTDPDFYPANLISLPELKVFLQLGTATDRDDYYTAAIAAASAAIARYSGRDFGVPIVVETREFQYEGDGTLDIDDCTLITRVAMKVPGSDDIELTSDSWSAQPPIHFESPVHYYILLPTVGRWGVSPEMGFARNLDVYAREGRLAQIPNVIKVTATWGWPDVPIDVKWATAWTVDEWTSRVGDGEGLTAEAIADYSRSWARSQGQAAASVAIPQRARDVLASYDRY